MKNKITKIIMFSILLFTLMMSINIAKPVFSYGETLSAIYQGNTDSNEVCFMINVYWGTEFLDEMLNTLDDYNVKTTFFVGGMWAEKEPDMLQKMYEKGHEIANHGYYHKDHDKLSAQQNIDEISNCHKIVKDILNIDMTLFAPPSGAYNNTTLVSAQNLNYKTIMWTRDTIDWRDHDTQLIYNRAIKNIKGGDLILMHPTQNTMEALPDILEYCKNNNIIATTVSNVLE